jgi:hypothetical protein
MLLFAVGMLANPMHEPGHSLLSGPVRKLNGNQSVKFHVD